MAEGKHHKRPLKATDKRRLTKKVDVVQSESGHGKDLASLFNDRRYPNGKGKRLA